MWYEKCVIKGSCLKEMWQENEKMTFSMEDPEGDVVQVSLTKDIQDDVWYETYNDMGKVKLFPVVFIDTKEAYNKMFEL